MEEIKKPPFFKSILGIVIIAVICLGVGFFAGFELKTYQVRQAINEFEEDIGETLSEIGNEDTPKKEEEEKSVIIEKNIGESFDLATIRVKITSSKENDKVYQEYSEPLVAKNGTKFVIVDAEITNITKEPFNYTPAGKLIDKNDTKYSLIEDIVSGDLYGDTLQPGVMVKGIMIFEIPENISEYSYTVGKKGTSEDYLIKLK